ncbi:phosphoglucosamine mutase, partial [Nocardioides sp. SOB72]|nr:phosphoglucosamine mutase [Nocardioides abyssi]
GLRAAGQLKDDTVVATVMSNLGFVNAMRAAGVAVRQTAVGDRYVLEEMNAHHYSLGGEQSGHVIMR